MKRIFTLLISLVSFSFVHSQVVISQIYGGGGNAGAPFRNDFVELYNTANVSVSLTGFSVQYASATGDFNSSNTVALNGSIPARGYYLVQFASGGAVGANLPTPDALTNNTNLSATAGKVALVSNLIPLTSCPVVPLVAPVLDYVGYGTANCSLAAPAPASSNTTAVLRKGGGTVNTFNNAADFETGAPNPRNSGFVLPVLLVSFTATAQNNATLFQWKTATEQNTRHFEIEQSADGRNFTAFATLAAAGNSTSEKSYTYRGSLNSVTTYYRLKTVDTDGKFSTSAVVKITPAQNGFSLGNVYPVPAKNNVTIEWNSNLAGATTITITDISGRTLRTLPVNAVTGFNRQVMDVQGLATGQYYIQVNSPGGKMQTFITKQ